MLDVMMPEMDGYEACRAMRALPGNESLPILMMTANDDIEAITAAYSAGTSEFTAKPINWTIESYRLRNMLRGAADVKKIYVAKQEWERTFNSLDEHILIQNPDMTIIKANKTALDAINVPSESVMGKTCSEVFCKRSDECPDCPVKAAAASGKKMVVERVDECLEGTFLVTIIPVFDDAGNLAQIVHMSKDITERQMLESEVRRAQKMEAVGTLSGGLAHDFNNLLQVVIGYSDLLARNYEPEDQSFQYLNEIKEAAWRGSEITRQLLTVSRKTESRKECLQLNNVVGNLGTLLERTIPKMIAIEQDLADDLHTVNADGAQLEQVLMNLAVNAKHAMPEGGKLHFETRNMNLDHTYCRMHPNVEPGDYVLLSVTDTGCGMDEKTQAHIFEPFFTTRSPDKGTGLGLAMVYGIVQKHEGHLICYSEEGEGTTFKIYLPVMEGTVPSKAALSMDEEAAGGEEVVMLVDDVAHIRHIGKRILSDAGYRVILAVNGQNALEIHEAEEGKIDFVILDLNMPVMGGLECLDILRVRDPELPVLLASGFALSDESKRRMCDKVDFLSKPYHPQEILRTMRTMLDQA